MFQLKREMGRGECEVKENREWNESGHKGDQEMGWGQRGRWKA